MDILIWFQGHEDCCISLSNCPFCGAEPFLHQIGNYNSKKYSIKVGCKKCRFYIQHSSLGRTGFEELIGYAHSSWNKRP